MDWKPNGNHSEKSGGQYSNASHCFLDRHHCVRGALMSSCPHHLPSGNQKRFWRRSGAMERKAIAAIVSVARIIAPWSYHFVVAVGRVKEPQSRRANEILDDYLLRVDRVWDARRRSSGNLGRLHTSTSRPWQACRKNL